MGLQLGKWNGAPSGADGMPLALLPRLNGSFSMRFSLTYLFAIAASTVIHTKPHIIYVGVTDINTSLLISSYISVNLVGNVMFSCQALSEP